jgi:hypothetical protein
MRIQLFATGLLMGVCLFGLNGCGKGPAPSESAHDHGHGHVHDEPGPHGGHIIEIDAKDHHVELVHDEASHKVGVWLLDGDAKTVAPIEATSVMINVSEDGVASQYELPAVPQSGDAEGASSYFEIVSEPLCKVVCGESEAKSVQARISLKMGMKPYVGFIDTAPHDHDHGHAHDEHAHEGEHEDEHGEEHKDEHADGHKDAPVGEPADVPQAQPAEEPKAEPAAEPADAPAEAPADAPATEPADEQTDGQ